MDRSPEIDKLATSLAKAQAQIRNAREESTNPHLKSKYADLTSVWEACREALTSQGLSVAQLAEPGPEAALMLTTMLLHESGQFLSGTLLMPLVKVSPQDYGAALTYARRYALAAMVGVCPEDDDGHSATQAQAYANAEERPRQRPPVKEEPRKPTQTRTAAPQAPAPESGGDQAAQFPEGWMKLRGRMLDLYRESGRETGAEALYAWVTEVLELPPLKIRQLGDLNDDQLSTLIRALEADAAKAKQGAEVPEAFR